MRDSGPIPHILRRDLIARLRRIEGQAQGVQRMLEQERGCSEVIHQLASIRAATRSASRALINHYVQARLHSASGDEAEEVERAIADVLSVLAHAP
jgi:DNA-binding FrmR family transcriptional regulator